VSGIDTPEYKAWIAQIEQWGEVRVRRMMATKEIQGVGERRAITESWLQERAEARARRQVIINLTCTGLNLALVFGSLLVSIFGVFHK